MTNKQERRIQIKRLEALINGETVDGLKLNDPGLRYDYVMGLLAALRKQERESSRPAEQSSERITHADMNNKLSTEEAAELEVSTWTFEKQVEIITEALNQATERAAKTDDPVHWSVVDGWEKRLMDTVNRRPLFDVVQTPQGGVLIPR